MNKTLQKAIDGARAIPYVKGQQRHFALVTDKRGKVIGSGANSYSRTHTISFKHGKAQGNIEKCYIHAEQQAIIRSLKSSVKEKHLYVARVYANGEPAPSMPCEICMSFIRSVGNIKSISFT
ncbi:Cytidine and deoxycytidylate deaminase zinc-binding region [compost metagenome]